MAAQDDIVHAQTRALLTYWQGLRAGRSVPHRNDIDPRHMDCNIGNLFIIEVLESGVQQFRVAGSQVIDIFGMELRGRSVRSIMEGKARDSLTALVAETLAEPGIGYARLIPGTGGTELWEMLLLPLESDSGRVDRLIGFLFQLVGSQNVERLVPLTLTIERMSIEPIEPAVDLGAQPGLAEQQSAFSGLPAPSRAARLTAIQGGLEGGQPRHRPRPTLRVIEDD